jgi:hypothetical protein
VVEVLGKLNNYMWSTDHMTGWFQYFNNIISTGGLNIIDKQITVKKVFIVYPGGR